MPSTALIHSRYITCRESTPKIRAARTADARLLAPGIRPTTNRAEKVCQGLVEPRCPSSPHQSWVKILLPAISIRSFWAPKKEAKAKQQTTTLITRECYNRFTLNNRSATTWFQSRLTLSRISSRGQTLRLKTIQVWWGSSPNSKTQGSTVQLSSCSIQIRVIWPTKMTWMILVQASISHPRWPRGRLLAPQFWKQIKAYFLSMKPRIRGTRSISTRAFSLRKSYSTSW
jgi:hypothetical protein